MHYFIYFLAKLNDLFDFFHKLLNILTECIYNMWLGHSVFGGFLIIAGLYVVTWASYKEKLALGIPHVTRTSEPLIHKDLPISKIPYQRGNIFSGSSNSVPKPSD